MPARSPSWLVSGALDNPFSESRDEKLRRHSLASPPADNAGPTTNKRSIKADDFFQGLFSTALEDGEIITAVSFPVPAKAGYAKMRHPASRFALTAVFVAKTKAGDVRAARDAFQAAVTNRGWTVERVRDGDTFCRLLVHGGEDLLVDIALDSPPTRPATTSRIRRARSGTIGERPAKDFGPLTLIFVWPCAQTPWGNHDQDHAQHDQDI